MGLHNSEGEELLLTGCRWDRDDSGADSPETSPCHCRDSADCAGCVSALCLCPSGCRPGYTGDRCQHLCPMGSYGVQCSGQCGQCRHGQCNPVTGTCPSGCRPHWTGTLCHIGNDTCQLQPCTCDACLEGNHDCDISTGVCLRGCRPGFTGKSCTQRE
ncbi:hypothetical protein ACOMHN_045961 [Nucella lapillus]